MDHELVMEGPGFRLRPVRLEDASFMVELRTNPELSHFISPTSRDVADQQRYLRDYLERPADYYFIVEHASQAEPHGTIALYDVDREAGTAEWGRWVLKKGSPAALESAFLIYRVAFEVLDLDVVYCRTIVENEHVVSFHRSFGLETVRTLPAYAHIGDRVHDSLEQRMTRELWEERRPRLEQLVARVARRRLQRG